MDAATAIKQEASVKPLADSLKPIALAEIATKLALNAKFGQKDDQVAVRFENDTVVLHQVDFAIAQRAALRIRSKIPRQVTPGALITLVGEAQRAVGEEIFRPGAVRVIYYTSQSKASAFYRCLMPMYALNTGGAAMAHTSARFGREALDYDVAVIQIDSSPAALNFMTSLQARGKKVVYEIDDAFDCLEPWHPQYASYSQPAHQAAVMAMMTQADAVQVSTRWLAARYSDLAKRIQVVPNMVELTAWPRAERLHHEGRWRVLWAGSPSHSGDLDLVTPALAAFAKAHRDVNIVFFGQSPKGDEIPVDQVEVVDWCEFEEYPTRLAAIDADVAIAPLVDVPFNRGKSNVRILQYWATGYPVIASDVEPHKGSISQGVNGILAQNADAWLAALEMTYRNEPVCRRLTDAGFESVKASDVLANSKGIEEFYASLTR